MPLHFLPSSQGLAILDLPGIADGQVEGPPTLVNALISAAIAPPDACYGQPLQISLQFAQSSAARYPLWAFWLKADAVWESRFGPLGAWRSQLPSTHHARPLLVIARAQGHWELGECFSPQLARLLHEKDPLGTPDGRMLVYAAPPSMPLRDSLHAGVKWFLDSMRPSSQEPLPENCLMLRSGCSSVEWDLPFPAAVLVRASRQGLSSQHPDPPLFRIPLAHGLRVQTNWKGPLLWGAWRGERRQERFLTLGYHAGDAIRGGVNVQLAREGQSRALFHGALTRASGGASITRAASDALLDRSLRTIARNLAEHSEIRHAMETPYAELLRTFAPNPLTLCEAASMPSAEPLAPLSGAFKEDGAVSGSPFPPDGLCGELQQQREVRMVLSGSKAAVRNGSFHVLKPVRRRYRGRTNAA